MSTQSAAPEMKVCSVSLDSESARWYAAAMNSQGVRNRSSEYSAYRSADDGNVMSLARGVNQQVVNPFLDKRMTISSIGYPREGVLLYTMRPFSLLAP